MEDATRVSILGPIEVGTAGRRVPVAGIKQQSLLAMLALATPHAVSDDHLIDELWGDEQPANPANALQALVSQLRRLLGRDVVGRVGAGYVLRLAADDVDVTRLERLVEEGREAAARGDRPDAVERFRDAVALVRGPPLGDLADAWFARDALARLDELVAAANEGLVDAELAMGRHVEVLPLLVELVGRHPLRERLRVQLVLALYRAGRQADALQALRDAREHLLEELGLDPGPELQSLERAVLAHDPALAAPIALAPIAHDRLTLPAPLTSFVGRAHELDALEATTRTTRLTTVVGPGGVGKTRLVTELLRRTDGEVWFVELGPLTVAGAVAEAVAAGVGAPERAPSDGQPPPSPEQRAVERLRDRAAVVVLDNCEHVVAAVARCVLTLLAGCPRLRVVATSREPLGVEGERQFVVGPLPADESAQLFVERARAVQPYFTPDDDGNADLVELCRHLDGLPLAIELAAARAKTLPVPEITERLRDRFALLRRAQPTGTDRHDGLEAAIDWSYELLFDDERRTLRAFAVFAGGATLDAAERVCGPDAFELASRLVDRSLLVADTSRRAVRFVMLESLRAYGLERLVERGELRRRPRRPPRVVHRAGRGREPRHPGARPARLDRAPRRRARQPPRRAGLRRRARSDRRAAAGRLADPAVVVARPPAGDPLLVRGRPRRRPRRPAGRAGPGAGAGRPVGRAGEPRRHGRPLRRGPPPRAGRRRGAPARGARHLRRRRPRAGRRRDPRRAGVHADAPGLDG